MTVAAFVNPNSPDSGIAPKIAFTAIIATQINIATSTNLIKYPVSKSLLPAINLALKYSNKAVKIIAIIKRSNVTMSSVLTFCIFSPFTNYSIFFSLFFQQFYNFQINLRSR